MVRRGRLADLTERLHTHGRRYGREAYNRCPRTATVSRGRWRIAGAAVSGVIAVLFSILGLVVSTVAFLVAFPFFIAAVVLWRQGARRVGQAHRRSTKRATDRRRAAGGERTASGSPRELGEAGPTVSPSKARSILDVPPDADNRTIRRAYRERIKEVHPDQGGDEARFREVTAAYETLQDEAER